MMGNSKWEDEILLSSAKGRAVIDVIEGGASDRGLGHASLLEIGLSATVPLAG